MTEGVCGSLLTAVTASLHPHSLAAAVSADAVVAAAVAAAAATGGEVALTIPNWRWLEVVLAVMVVVERGAEMGQQA